MQLKIEKLIYEGYGLGHDPDGSAVFVKKSVPGDELEIDIIKEKKNFKEGIIKKIIQPSLLRIEPACPHFDLCGGCEHQNIAYKDQLKLKEEIFREVLARAKIDTEILPIIAGSDSEHFYRNTQRFSINVNQNDELIYQMHDFLDFRKMVEIKSCLLQSEFCNTFLQKFKEFADENIVDKSILKQLRIREGKATGQFMIELFVANQSSLDKTILTNFIKQFPEIASFYLCTLSDGRIEHAKRHLLYGSPIISEKIGKFTFQISPDSFFQTNSLGVQTLYDQIKKFADVRIGESVLDLYCGTGTISIYLSTLAKKVTGVDIIQSATNDANANAKINHVSNCEFICADATRWLKNITSNQCQNTCSSMYFDTIIVDPPRQGLDKDLLDELSTFTNFKNLVYISCDPATFARDIKEFSKYGLKLKKVLPVDMFPQTHHIECIGLIKR